MQPKRRQIPWTAPLFIAMLFAGCAKKTTDTTTDIAEPAQQIADVMASIDEVAGASGSYLVKVPDLSTKRLFARYNVETAPNLSFVPTANAASCASAGSGAFTTSGSSPCVLTRTFNVCTIGFGTFVGNVEMTFSGATCKLASNGQSVVRAPEFQVTGLRDSLLTVSVPAGASPAGQQISRISATEYTFTNGGIQRVFTKDGNTVFDFTTTTTSAISLSGAIRSNRVLSGGSLRVTNNVSGRTCDYVPTNVTWGSTCNCPTSGSWTGSCSDGTSTTLNITGCGSGTFTIGTDTNSVSFDRCYLI